LKMAFHLSVLRILGGYISLGCITKCHWLSNLNNRNLFSPSSGS
jgi:hypothetical protein